MAEENLEIEAESSAIAAFTLAQFAVLRSYRERNYLN